MIASTSLIKKVQEVLQIHKSPTIFCWTQDISKLRKFLIVTTWNQMRISECCRTQTL